MFYILLFYIIIKIIIEKKIDTKLMPLDMVLTNPTDAAVCV